MTKREASKYLLKAIEALKENRINRDVWQSQTASLIDLIFGPESQEYYFISKFQFGVWHLSGEDPDLVRLQLESKRPQMEEFLQSCIETIAVKGIYRPHKHNFFDRIDNWKIVTILASIFLIGIIVGYNLPPVWQQFLNRVTGR
jgi:hypothetical protein